MTHTNEAWAGSLAAAKASMNLYTALASDADDPERNQRIYDAFEAIHANCPGPREFHSALFSLVRVAGAMLRTATGDTNPEPWALVFATPDGVQPDPDQVPPPVRFAARWITAAANDDIDTCMDLWFGVDVSEDESSSITNLLMPLLVGFLEGAVRTFLDAGKPLDLSLLTAAGQTYPGPRTCRQCGCTDNAACVGLAGDPCSWAEQDLCSSCKGVVL